MPMPKPGERVVLSVDWDWFAGAYDAVSCEMDLCGWHCSTGNDPGWQGPKAGIRPRLADFKGVFSDHSYSKEKVRQNIERMWRLCPVIKPGAEVIVAECHGSIYRFLEQGDHIWDFDDHVDECMWEDNLNCSNWRWWAKKRLKCQIHDENYPKRKVPPIDLVFLCQSQPWTPLEHDEMFFGLMEEFSKKSSTKPRFIGTMARRLKRDYVQIRNREVGDAHGGSEKLGLRARGPEDQGDEGSRLSRVQDDTQARPQGEAVA